MIYPVVLAGGMGTRLWPLSRELYPKQCLSLLGDDHSLLQHTLLRLGQVDNVADVTVICHEQHRFLVAQQAAQTGVKCGPIILEPKACNTAPAIAAAVNVLLNRADVQADPHAVFWFVPADHAISDDTAFAATAALGFDACLQNEQVVTFGIRPTHGHTGYGYIELADASLHDASHEVLAFKEKPDEQQAQQFVESGRFLWNSGMFMAAKDSWLNILLKHIPHIWKLTHKAVQAAQTDLDFLRLDANAYQYMPEQAFDYAVMEKLSQSLVVPMPSIWSDVGAWSAMWDVNQADDQGNVVQADAVVEQSQGCYIHSDYRLVAALGLSDLVIVDTQDALLVAHKDKAQEVKHVVAKLHQEGRDEGLQHTQVFRPWGYYQTMDVGAGFKVKRIVVKPLQSLSVQQHKLRAEHWVVVKGAAEVTRGEQVFTLAANQSTYISPQTVHCLRNPSADELLEVIEVQTGEYLQEDDIVRLSDQYGRGDNICYTDPNTQI
ncbi:mannose-1-phosphate guanylyltransferase/mannose-6-phosphate isomerase [Bermanella sp. R86510]|uniref:mannose-1-phosphate guanylyltransferase/mannose-6-phosphate isomerase n=1 Tax=unclassified Bermanella TaxID=2627862 RepID=UPI0037C8B098